MKINSFTFYKPVKNEDADPFIYNDRSSGVIIAADGLGGSGSFVHELSDKNAERLGKDLKKAVLPELFDKNLKEEDLKRVGQDFRDWFDAMLKPMLDGESDTSALWASRIAISRFAFYLLENYDGDLKTEKFRNSAVDFVYKGLLNVAEEFDLKVEGGFEQSLLPTTLVGIKYAVNEENDCVLADVVWAGDSRAYALCPEGSLKQLTVDDEDNSGAITNLFSLRNGKATDTRLHCASYLLPTKSVLFACSDGFFDLYDPIGSLGVEQVLLDCISRSDGFGTLKNKWYKNFVDTQHDDCTVGFAAIGFADFDELKKLTEERYLKVNALFNDFVENKGLLPVIQGVYELPEEYVYERAERRKDEIARILAEGVMNDPDFKDPALLPRLKSLKGELQDYFNEQALEKRSDRFEEIFEEIKEAITLDSKEIEAIFKVRSVEEIVRSEPGRSLKDLKRAVLSYSKSYKEYDEALKNENKAAENLNKEWQKCKTDRNKLYKRLESLENLLDKITLIIETVEEVNNELSSILKQKVKDVEFLEKKKAQKKKLENNIKSLTTLTEMFDQEEFKSIEYHCYPIDAQLIGNAISRLKKYSEAKKALKEGEERAEKSKADLSDEMEKYETLLNSIDFKFLLPALKDPKNYFSAEAIERFKFNETVDARQVDTQSLIETFLLCFDREKESLNALVERFINSNEPSVIDSIFNQSKLKLLKQYKTADIDRLKKLIEDIDETMDAYLSVGDIKL